MSLSRQASPAESKPRLSRRQRKLRRREITQSQWAREQREVETDVALPDRIDAFHQHGDFSMAWSTVVQPRLSHFGSAEGYVAFRQRWKQTIALGDPVCDTAQAESLLVQFIDTHRHPSFIQISKPIATILSRHGYRINQMGLDTTVHLPDYDFKGKKKEWLRYAANWTDRRGFEVRECGFDQISSKEVEAVSEAWRKTRTVKTKEVRFLNRPIVLSDEPDVRKFFLLDPQGKIVAFVFLDPLFRDGEIFGYVTAFKRRHPDAPIYSEQALMKGIIEKLKLEGVNELRLGLSPCASIEPSGFAESVWMRRLFQWAFESSLINRRAYNLSGHAVYKRRFRGDDEKVYLASPPGLHPRRIPALIAMCGIA